MNTCPDDGTITELDYCPNCDIVLVGDNKGKERRDVEPVKKKAK